MTYLVKAPRPKGFLRKEKGFLRIPPKPLEGVTSGKKRVSLRNLLS